MSNARPQQLQKTTQGPAPLDERLLRRRHITESGCWEYMGMRTDRGYGNITVGSLKDGSRRVLKVHRVAYALWVGTPPEGMDLDHLCRNPACFNPDHLEAVTHKENLSRGLCSSGSGKLRTPYEQMGPCKNGHERTPENTYIRAGKKSCKPCVQERKRLARKDLRKAS